MDVLNHCTVPFDCVRKEGAATHLFCCHYSVVVSSSFLPPNNANLNLTVKLSVPDNRGKMFRYSFSVSKCRLRFFGCDCTNYSI